MKRSLKSGRSESSTYSTSSHERRGRGALLRREQDHLRALARDVAGRDDPRQRELRHEADADGAGGREVRAERAGQQHLLDVGDLRRRAPRRAAPSRSRSRPSRTAARARRAARGRRRPRGRPARRAQCEHEDALAVDARRGARRARGCELGRVLVGDEAAGVVEQAALDELRDGVDEPRAADAERRRRRRSRRASTSSSLMRTTSIAPSAARMPQRICAASKAGPGGRGGREQPLGAAERDLAVRADVDEQAQPLVAGHARRQQARDDVAADVRAERREDVRVRARVHA